MKVGEGKEVGSRLIGGKGRNGEVNLIKKIICNLKE